MSSSRFDENLNVAQDWRNHKPECGPVTLPASSECDASNQSTVLEAILLPVDEDAPRLINVICETEYYEDEGPWYEAKIKHLYPNMSFIRDMPIQTMGINGPALEGDRCIAMLYDDESLINGSSVNRCVQRLTNGKARHRWCGNLVVLRLHPCDFDVTKYRSANLHEDIEPVRRYLEDYAVSFNTI
ncbi:hypothetical protein K474DRAFT_1707355 [Panus rudis PR-1116 ss-1]|nr:hypothetical protein K474DRAFT_1707355 [Panus rudis PR-1116 ss-1]